MVGRGALYLAAVRYGFPVIIRGGWFFTGPGTCFAMSANIPVKTFFPVFSSLEALTLHEIVLGDGVGKMPAGKHDAFAGKTKVANI